MNDVINAIEEIESMLERKVEWELVTDDNKLAVKTCLQNIYGYTTQLKTMAEEMK
jgi:hypothetical protein